jgi:hypothetical protein
VGERVVEVCRSGGEDWGEPKLVWSNGEVATAVSRLESSRTNGPFPKVGGGDMVVWILVGNVASQTGGETEDVSDGDENISEGGVGAECCESCEWRTGGGGSMGMGGGTVATV